MTVVSDIIKQAYRESNLIAIGAAPSTDQQDEALKRLSTIVSGTYGFEVGEPLLDWPVGITGVTPLPQWNQDCWQRPGANARLIAASTVAEVVYLPAQPDDGARIALIDPSSRLAATPITIDANGRTIEGASSVTIDANGTSRIWFYRAELGGWVRLTALTDVTAEFPFPEEFDDFFITRLAMRLNPRYGRSIDPQSADALTRTENRLRARYRQHKVIPCDEGVLGLTSSRRVDYRPLRRGAFGWMG